MNGNYFKIWHVLKSLIQNPRKQNFFVSKSELLRKNAAKSWGWNVSNQIFFFSKFPSKSVFSRKISWNLIFKDLSFNSNLTRRKIFTSKSGTMQKSWLKIWFIVNFINQIGFGTRFSGYSIQMTILKNESEECTTFAFFLVGWVCLSGGVFIVLGLMIAVTVDSF